jgi:hypothetical protein
LIFLDWAHVSTGRLLFSSVKNKSTKYNKAGPRLVFSISLSKHYSLAIVGQVEPVWAQAGQKKIMCLASLVQALFHWHMENTLLVGPISLARIALPWICFGPPNFFVPISSEFVTFGQQTTRLISDSTYIKSRGYILLHCSILLQLCLDTGDKSVVTHSSLLNN